MAVVYNTPFELSRKKTNSDQYHYSSIKSGKYHGSGQTGSFFNLQVYSAQSKQKSYPSFDLEKSVNRAKWFLEDLQKGTGWSQAFDSWIKTFPEEHVPVKTVYMIRDMPLSPEKIR